MLSIVIPVYNVEKYVGECVDSCLNQEQVTLGRDYELVIVNDGTPDHSMDIVRKHLEGYTGYKIVEQANKGLGGARNTGIDNAQGDYVWFVDSDDWIVPDAVSTILKNIADGSNDALAITCLDRLPEGDVQRKTFQGLGSVISGVDLFKSHRYSFCAPFTIYKRSYLIDNKLRFQEHLFHEDNEFTPRAYLGLNEIKLIERPLYIVRHNPESITRSVNVKKNFDLLKIAATLSQFVSANVSKEDAPIYNEFIAIALNRSFFNNEKMDADTLKKFKQLIKDNKGLFVSFRRSGKLKHKVEWLFFTFLPFNNVTVYNKILSRI